tara:strand:+ start:105 stop:1571 length:1467 start_codon:yes stop_codon:yes gene_type:complete
MELSTQEIRNKLQNSKLIKSKIKLIQYLNFTKNNFIRFTLNINGPVKYNPETKFDDNKYLNPILWQMGHVTFFYVNLVIKNLEYNPNEDGNYLLEIINNIENKKVFEFYDSHKTPLEYRNNKEKIFNYSEVITFYKIVIEFIEKYIKNKLILSRIDIYLIMLGILHNEMHNEAFIFTKLKLNPQYYIFNDFNRFYSQEIESDTIELSLKSLEQYSQTERNLIQNIEYVDYSCGDFIQGVVYSYNYLHFDNEKPAFKKYLDSFSISKYQITENQYLQFILSSDYENENYWSTIGFEWKQKNNIKCPLYWEWNHQTQKYYKMINAQRYSVETNLPIVHISYYEAEAYCKWVGGRLPTESEYEYVATNKGTTRFPWGDKKNIDIWRQVNLNYKNYLMPVNYFKFSKSQNKMGIHQLIGNAWEWCQEAIYPYDGFVIDPVYREMSYPFFGYKKICKGGAFCVPDFLIHPKYRNAQYPDCRIQFIGFRVCKDI